jgi:hypothetical protein
MANAYDLVVIGTAVRLPSGPRLEMSGLQGLIMLQEMAERLWRVQRPM